MAYSSDLSAVSEAAGGSQVTLAVSFPGSATFSLDGGHLIFGGSVSEMNSWKLKNNTGDIKGSTTDLNGDICFSCFVLFLQ